MKCGARFGGAIDHRVCDAKKRGHHRFSARIPEITVVFDNTGVDLDVPVRNIDIANALDLPEMELAVGAV